MLVPLVEERSIKFKHQLMLTKLHVVTYWISVFIWNAIFYTFYCSFLLLFFLYFGWMKGHFGRFVLFFLQNYFILNTCVPVLSSCGLRIFGVMLPRLHLFRSCLINGKEHLQLYFHGGLSPQFSSLC